MDDEERLHRARVAHVREWFLQRRGRSVTAEVVTRDGDVETRVHEATGPLLTIERHPEKPDTYRIVFDGSGDPAAASATPWLVLDSEIIDVLEAPGELAILKPSQRFEFHDGHRRDDGVAIDYGADASDVARAPAPDGMAARALPGNLMPGGSRFTGTLSVRAEGDRVVVTGRRATPQAVFVAGLSRTLLAVSVVASAVLVSLVFRDAHGASPSLVPGLLVSSLVLGASSAWIVVASWMWLRSASPVESIPFVADGDLGRLAVLKSAPESGRGTTRLAVLLSRPPRTSAA